MRKTLFTADNNPRGFVGERKRRTVSTGPILKGAFGESFKSLWSGGRCQKSIRKVDVSGS